eukprot:m.109024 g.109024  ORF g.109024 m.109024 type:complete len:89 (+) comp37334_c0_seq5:215-481(+)
MHVNEKLCSLEYDSLLLPGKANAKALLRSSLFFVFVHRERCPCLQSRLASRGGAGFRAKSPVEEISSASPTALFHRRQFPGRLFCAGA